MRIIRAISNIFITLTVPIWIVPVIISVTVIYALLNFYEDQKSMLTGRVWFWE